MLNTSVTAITSQSCVTMLEGTSAQLGNGKPYNVWFQKVSATGHTTAQMCKEVLIRADLLFPGELVYLHVYVDRPGPVPRTHS